MQVERKDSAATAIRTRGQFMFPRFRCSAYKRKHALMAYSVARRSRALLPIHEVGAYPREDDDATLDTNEPGERLSSFCPASSPLGISFTLYSLLLSLSLYTYYTRLALCDVLYLMPLFVQLHACQRLFLIQSSTKPSFGI